MIELCPAGRAGTPDEVGTVGALLMGPDGAVHHRQRLPDGRRRHRRLLVRRTRPGIAADPSLRPDCHRPRAATVLITICLPLIDCS